MLDLIGTTKSLYSSTKTAVQRVPCRAYKKRSNKTRAVRHTQKPSPRCGCSRPRATKTPAPCRAKQTQKRSPRAHDHPHTKAEPTSPRINHEIPRESERVREREKERERDDAGPQPITSHVLTMQARSPSPSK